MSASALDRWISQSQKSGSFKEKANRTIEENELLALRKENVGYLTLTLQSYKEGKKMKKYKVIIIGSGIAGLCSAIAFQRIGVEVKIYEKSAHSTAAGAGIIIAPNALQALETLGIAEQIVSAGKVSSGFHLLSDKGKTITKLTVPSGFRPLYSIHRKNLHQLLISALLPSTIEWETECVKIEQVDHGVRIAFRDGREAEGSILIAADGIHSTIRKQLFTKNYYRYAGYTCWRGVVSSYHLPGLSDNFIETWGTEGRFGIVPLPNNQVYWYALLNARANDNRYSKYTANDLYAHFKNYHDPIPSLVKNTANDQMIHRDIIDMLPMEQFYVNRVVFIGDAAHSITPNMGQGACQAIEDAVILVECFRKSADTHQAFVAYDTRRRKRIKQIASQSWNLGKVAQSANPTFATLRNWMMKNAPKSIYQKQAQDLYTFQLLR